MHVRMLILVQFSILYFRLTSSRKLTTFPRSRRACLDLEISSQIVNVYEIYIL